MYMEYISHFNTLCHKTALDVLENSFSCFFFHHNIQKKPHFRKNCHPVFNMKKKHVIFHYYSRVNLKKLSRNQLNLHIRTMTPCRHLFAIPKGAVFCFKCYCKKNG